MRSLAGKPALILRNHGLLAWGETLPRAFYTLWLMQRACEIQIASAALGPSLPISEDLQRRCHEDAMRHFSGDGASTQAFEAMVRRVDRIDASYKS